MTSPQTLDLADRRVLAAWAAECAAHVLWVFEEAVPGDCRVQATAVARMGKNRHGGEASGPQL